MNSIESFIVCFKTCQIMLCSSCSHILRCYIAHRYSQYLKKTQIRGIGFNGDRNSDIEYICGGTNGFNGSTWISKDETNFIGGLCKRCFLTVGRWLSLIIVHSE
jgi:hypothetical protein